MLGPFVRPMAAMEGPFVEAGGGMYAGANDFDMERWFEDYEWSVCWDFEMKSWGHPSTSKGGAIGWQQQHQQPSWAMKEQSWGAGPPGPPPGPPPGAGGPWFAEASSKGSWGPSSLDGPYIGDANSGENEDESWGGGNKSWKGSSKSWGRGRGGKGWNDGDGETEESWQGSSWWKEDSWGNAGRGRGKGSGKKGDAEDKAWPSENWSSSKNGKGAGKDGKGGEESKGKGKTKKGKDSQAWQTSNRDGGGEGESSRTGDAAKEDVVAEIDALLAEAKNNLEKADFDFRVRRFLFALRTSGGRQKVRDALAMIQTYTQQKSRQSVKNWPAYLLTLLKKFEPEPFAKAKSKAKERGVDRDQERSETRAPGPASSKKAPQPVAASANAVPDGDEDGDIEVVRADEEEPSPSQKPLPAADLPKPSFDVTLPPGWEDGRSVLLQEISSALSSNSASKDSLRCPFTSKPLDIEAVLISQIASSLRASASSNASDQLAAHHIAGLARSRGVVDCPRAAAATALLALEHGLHDDASAMDAVVAYSKVEASTSTTVLQEIALELTAEILRNPQLGTGETS